MQKATRSLLLLEAQGRTIRKTNGALLLASWKCQEGWVMGPSAHTNQGGEPVAEADLRAEGPALTFIYIAWSTHTPGKFSVLIWASGLRFIIFLNHPPPGPRVNKAESETNSAPQGSSGFRVPGSAWPFLEGMGGTCLMHEGFCWDLQHGPACLGSSMDTALECEIGDTHWTRKPGSPLQPGLCSQAW